MGDTFQRSDPTLQLQALAEVFEAVQQELAPARSTSSTELDRGPVHPPTTADEFEALLTMLREGPLDELNGPARRLAATPVDLWPHVRDALIAPRKPPKGDYRAVLDVIGGDVPNRYGHFARAWKKAHGHQVKLSTDWFEDLLGVQGGQISPALLPVFRDCIVQAALLRAATHAGQEGETSTVIATLLDVAYLHHGTFRDEVGRAIQSVGDIAIPALISASTSPEDPEDLDAAKRATYARFNLDRMDRLHPRRATAAVRDQPDQLAAVLSAYGENKVGEAADTLLAFADDPSPVVRLAAREAFAKYVTGPAPTTQRREVRLLGGAVTHARAYLTYRERAEDALIARLEPDQLASAYDPQTDAQATETLMNLYFDELDQARQSFVDRSIEDALTQPRLEQRAAALNRLLIERPTPEQLRRIVPVFIDYGREREAASDHTGAAAQFRKAAVLSAKLDPPTAKSLEVAALINEAFVPKLPLHGRHMLLETASEVAPDDPRIAVALERSTRARQAEARTQVPPLWRPMALAAAILVSLALGLSLVERRRRFISAVNR